jgi:hypothetical protein
VEAFVFPDPPNAKALEWPGGPIGSTNVVTRLKARLPVRDVSVDRVEGRRDELVTSAVEHIVRRAGTEPLALCDAVIHGVRVRAVTNSAHLAQFWSAHWYRADEWRRATGFAPPPRPQVTVYAIGGVAEQQAGAYYSHRTGTAVLFNTAYYGELASAAVAAVGRLLAEARGIHSIHGACVGVRDGGALCIGPCGIGRSALAFGLAADDQGARFVSHDTVYVRYMLTTREGQLLAPYEVTPAHGRPVRGYRVFRWLETHRGATGRLRGTGLDQAEITLPLSGLDLTRPVQAYAYPGAREAYVPTDIAAAVPAIAPGLLNARLENVPETTPDWLGSRAAPLDALADAAGSAGDGLGDADARGELRARLAALIACPESRGLLDLAQGPLARQLVANPMEGMPLSTAVLFRRDARDRTVIEPLPLARFIERLLRGEGPGGTRVVAYNPDRAASPQMERTLIDTLAGDTAARGGGADEFYRAFERSPAVPPTLTLEGELFRMLHRAVGCYALNAVFDSDPEVRDAAEARALTNALVVRAAAARGGDLRLDLGGYRRALAEAPPPVAAAGSP